MSLKLFTLLEANQLLPSLEPLVRRLMAKREELRHWHGLQEASLAGNRRGKIRQTEERDRASYIPPVSQILPSPVTNRTSVHPLTRFIPLT